MHLLPEAAADGGTPNEQDSMYTPKAGEKHHVRNAAQQLDLAVEDLAVRPRPPPGSPSILPQYEGPKSHKHVPQDPVLVVVVVGPHIVVFSESQGCLPE